MKTLIFLLMMGIFSCNPVKNTTAKEESMPEGSKVIPDSLPACVRALANKFKSEEMTNPPRKIYRYTYVGNKVYYVPAVCCDNFSDLYNDSCRLMGHPDGGFTGRGDGKITDFRTEAKDEKLMWSDPRAK